MALKNIKGKVIVSIDTEYKNSYKLTDGVTIKLERDVENLNKRETQAVNAIVIASDIIPIGSEVLVHHNSCHDVNRIFDYEPLSGESTSSSVKYYSISEGDCYLYRESKEQEFIPCKNIATALRIFKPYEGDLKGILPTLVKDKLFITSGEFKNKVCQTLVSCDYEIVYQGEDGREKKVIRLRHFEDELAHEREEIIAVRNDLTKDVLNGKLLIGLNVNDAKKIEK
jgi:hypothetical protein